jgi:hypothetical protein
MSEIGHIDCGYLATIQAKQERIWTDPIQKIDLIADTESAKAVLENQQVNFTEILGKKKRIMSVEWQTKCDVTTTACTDDCDITGADVEPECKEYEIECLRETTFQVSDRVYRERTIESTEAIALNMLYAKKALDEWLAAYIVTGLVAAGGTNVYTGGVGHVDVAETHINANFWDDNIWAYFNLVNAYNKFKSPYLLTGTNLHQYLFNRQHESMTEAGKSAMSKIGTIRRIYQDIVNVEAIAAGYTFLIHKTAVAFLNKAWNPLGAVNAQNKAGNYWLWSEPSMNIPGIYYDIVMKETCSDNDFVQAYKVQLHGLFAENPYPCDETNTGVLAFVCGGA